MEKYCDKRCQFFFKSGNAPNTVICWFMEAEVPLYFCHEWEKAELVQHLINIEA